MTVKFFIMLYLTLLCSFSAVASPVFSFHLLREPHTYDPAKVMGISGSYLFTSLYATLYRYDDNQGLIPELAKNCRWVKKVHLKCELDQRFKWSDGQPITAAQFVKGFQRLFNKDIKSTHAEFLLHLKNAHAILKGSKTEKDLGVVAEGSDKLNFYFDEVDGEFLYKLAHPGLTAYRQQDLSPKGPVTKIAFNGAFHIKAWKQGHWLELEPNKHYFRKQPISTLIKIYFVEEDNTALNLYQKHKLNFLRRITTPMIPKLKKEKGFFQKPIMRFDYIGFGKSLKNHPNLRKALVLSLNFPELQKLYDAKGVPGCPSFSADLLQQRLCYTFNLKAAKQALKKVPKKLLKQQWTLSYSQLGGDSIRIGMEWMQHQWKKHLGLTIIVQPEESAEMLHKLKQGSMAMFRKGMYLSRPTCLAALENFNSQSPENYIAFDNKKFDKLLITLNQTQSEFEKKKLCYRALKLIYDDYVLIPLGEIHFSMLEDQKFTGWQLNRLNHLYLANIKPSAVSK